MGFVDLGFPLNTLRIKGRAEIHAGPALCAEFEMQGRAAYGYINHRRQRLLSVPKGARALEGYGVRMSKSTLGAARLRNRPTRHAGFSAVQV